MKAARVIIIGMFVVAALVASPVMGAEDCVFAPEGGDTGSWANADNWDACGVNFPGSNDTATIPADKTCRIEADAAAKWIDVETDGTLEIRKGSSLTISKKSTVDGTLGIVSKQVGDPTNNKLIIAASLTITGNGGEIEMGADALIDDDGTSDYTLTLHRHPDCNTNLQRSCAVTLRGEGDINVTLTNNAFVIAVYAPIGSQTDCIAAPPLSLDINPKDGDGFWIAEAQGLLDVKVAVSGPGTWQLLDVDGEWDHCNRIEINACCVDATGTVELENGTFEVNQPFCTTGDLEWTSVDNSATGDTTPTIEVTANKDAGFAGTCGACP